MRKVCIVHFNTPILTECLVKSINKHMKDVQIYIFDNSDKQPYTYIIDNVTVFDNTKGQIINFDKWLQKYPNRNQSPGKLNNFGSAKHTYSIQKCIELIDDDFILMDSDILIKKPFDEFYDERYIYVGNTEQWGKTMRVIPYILYMNVKMMKQKHITFFDDMHMHGLCKTQFSDHYDTGGSFYLATQKIPSKKIDINDYIEHYKCGSWVDSAKGKYDKILTAEQWVYKYKHLWYETESKKVIYTCITGDYDCLYDVEYPELEYDYVCFTDNPDIEKGIWKIKDIPEELKDLSKVKQQRCIKINAHKYLSEYELSVWIDGAIKLTGSVDKYVKEHCDKNEAHIFIPKHPNRDCIYEEMKACKALKKDKIEIMQPQIDRYISEGYPKKYGLVQSNIIIRYHNEDDCKLLMEKWSEELLNGSHRDQLSFNYCLWKLPDSKVSFLNRTTCQTQPFHWYPLHQKFDKNNKQVAQNTPVNQRYYSPNGGFHYNVIYA